MTNNPSCTFAGPKEKDLPFSINSEKYEEMECMLKEEILKLINIGVTNFIVSGETGINTTCAKIVIYFRDEMKYPIKLLPIIPCEDIRKGFNQRQIDDYEWIKQKADFFMVFYNKLNDRCVRRRNKFVIKNSGYLIAIWDGKKRGNVWDVVRIAKRRSGVERLLSTLLPKVLFQNTSIAGMWN